MEQKEQDQQAPLKPERRPRQKQKSLAGRSQRRGSNENDTTDFFSNTPTPKKHPHHGEGHHHHHHHQHRHQQEEDEPLMGPLLRRKKVTSLPLLDDRRRVEFFGEGRRPPQGQPRQRQQSEPQMTTTTETNTGTGRSHSHILKTTIPTNPSSNKPSSILQRILGRKQVALGLLPPEEIHRVRKNPNNSSSATDNKRNTTTQRRNPLQFSPRAG